MHRLPARLLLFLLLCLGLGGPATAAADDGFGVLVMAHGGDQTWNGQVKAMLEPLQRDYRLEIAFGMADPGKIQAAVSRLERLGVKRIGVIRLFISGESWRVRTGQILGIIPGAPPRPSGADHQGDQAHGGHDMSLWRIESNATFAMSKDGLSDASEMEAVLAERVRALSTDPARESILILAHGPEDDAENARWIEAIDARSRAVRALAPFRDVQIATLREDWPEKRSQSVARIRAFVEQGSKDGGSVLVVPYRVSGFGPYARVLEGLSYKADGRGLLPSEHVAQWVRRTAETLRTDLAVAAR